MKRKKNKDGRPTVRRSIEKFFTRAWTLEEASVYYAGSRAILPENQKLLDLIKQSMKTSAEEVHHDS